MPEGTRPALPPLPPPRRHRSGRRGATGTARAIHWLDGDPAQEALGGKAGRSRAPGGRAPGAAGFVVAPGAFPPDPPAAEGRRPGWRRTCGSGPRRAGRAGPAGRRGAPRLWLALVGYDRGPGHRQLRRAVPDVPGVRGADEVLSCVRCPAGPRCGPPRRRLPRARPGAHRQGRCRPRRWPAGAGAGGRGRGRGGLHGRPHLRRPGRGGQRGLGAGAVRRRRRGRGRLLAGRPADAPTLRQTTGASRRAAGIGPGARRPGADQRRDSLPDPGAARPGGRAGPRAEAVLDAPVDVEWAVAGDRVWLLQARPITTGAPARWPRRPRTRRRPAPLGGHAGGPGAAEPVGPSPAFLPLAGRGRIGALLEPPGGRPCGRWPGTWPSPSARARRRRDHQG